MLFFPRYFFLFKNMGLFKKFFPRRNKSELPEVKKDFEVDSWNDAEKNDPRGAIGFAVEYALNNFNDDRALPRLGHLFNQDKTTNVAQLKHIEKFFRDPRSLEDLKKLPDDSRLKMIEYIESKGFQSQLSEDARITFIKTKESIDKLMLYNEDNALIRIFNVKKDAIVCGLGEDSVDKIIRSMLPIPSDLDSNGVQSTNKPKEQSYNKVNVKQLENFFLKDPKNSQMILQDPNFRNRIKIFVENNPELYGQMSSAAQIKSKEFIKVVEQRNDANRGLKM